MRLYKRVKELLLPTQLIDKNLNIKLGFIMWSLLIFSYALFVVNWGFVTGLNGQGGNDPGILSSFFKDGDKLALLKFKPPIEPSLWAEDLVLF